MKGDVDIESGIDIDADIDRYTHMAVEELQLSYHNPETLFFY